MPTMTLHLGVHVSLLIAPWEAEKWTDVVSREITLPAGTVVNRVNCYVRVIECKRMVYLPFPVYTEYEPCVEEKDLAITFTLNGKVVGMSYTHVEKDVLMGDGKAFIVLEEGVKKRNDFAVRFAKVHPFNINAYDVIFNFYIVIDYTGTAPEVDPAPATAYPDPYIDAMTPAPTRSQFSMPFAGEWSSLFMIIIFVLVFVLILEIIRGGRKGG